MKGNMYNQWNITGQVLFEISPSLEIIPQNFCIKLLPKQIVKSYF